MVATVLLFLCSFLVWLSAPTAELWIVAIILSEWGHFAAIGLLVGAALAWRLGNRVTALVALLAAFNLLSPLVRAVAIARTLPEKCTASFGNAVSAAGSRANPISLRDLFFGVPTSGVRVTEIVYAQNGAKPLKLDLYQATDATGPQPLIVMVHGGSWNGGNKAELPALNRYLARRHYAVAAINYRHAPKQPFPAAVEDVFRAIDFLRRHAVEGRIDMSRIVLIGRSAGAQIALSVAYAGKEPSIRGVVSFYGPTDLVFGYENPSARWVLDSKKVLEDYLSGPLAAQRDAYVAASPVNFVNASTPPTLLIHGSLDPLVSPRHSELLAARLREVGRPNLFVRLPWATHGCDANLSGPSGQLSLYALDRFLGEILDQTRK